MTDFDDPLETPRQLGERYRRELRELVDGGEIGPAVAERILGDLFKPEKPGGPPMLRWSVWCAYVEEAGRQCGRRRLIDLTDAYRRLRKG